MLKTKSLQSRLSLWYLGSLLILSIFFILVVHIFALPYGIDYFFILLLILAGIGFIIIYRITHSITYLSFRIKRITRKNLTEKITDIHSGDEIEELADSFNSLLDRMQSAFDREQQFIADVAHEMKTPLATLRSTLEIARTKKRTHEEYEHILRAAIFETDQLSSTLVQVLDLAWSESPGHQKKMQPIALSELLQELGDIAQKLATKKHISVTTDLAKNLRINGYKEKLVQALMNIIENALKYTNDNGTVTITLAQKHTNAILIIEDTGDGISTEDLPLIFTRFYRGDKTGNIQGSGLGLPISKSLISLHHGSISVSSTLHKGTKVTVSLPLS